MIEMIEVEVESCCSVRSAILVAAVVSGIPFTAAVMAMLTLVLPWPSFSLSKNTGLCTNVDKHHFRRINGYK